MGPSKQSEVELKHKPRPCDVSHALSAHWFSVWLLQFPSLLVPPWFTSTSKRGRVLLWSWGNGGMQVVPGPAADPLWRLAWASPEPPTDHFVAADAPRDSHAPAKPLSALSLAAQSYFLQITGRLKGVVLRPNPATSCLCSCAGSEASPSLFVSCWLVATGQKQAAEPSPDSVCRPCPRTLLPGCSPVVPVLVAPLDEWVCSGGY